MKKKILFKLKKCYQEKGPLEATICRWYANFKHGRTSTEDALRSPNWGCCARKLPKSPRNRRARLKDTGKLLKTLKHTISKTVHNNSNMKKCCSKWVPHLLKWNSKLRIQCAICNGLRRTERIFWVGTWQWMKCRFMIILRSQKVRQSKSHAIHLPLVSFWQKSFYSFSICCRSSLATPYFKTSPVRSLTRKATGITSAIAITADSQTVQ